MSINLWFFRSRVRIPERNAYKFIVLGMVNDIIAGQSGDAYTVPTEVVGEEAKLISR